MIKATSGRSLNVMLQPTPNPVAKGAQTNFKVIFDPNAGTGVQPHIDYDLTISKDGSISSISASRTSRPTAAHGGRYCDDTLYISTTRCLYNEHYSVWDSLQSNKT
ncbi:MAG TPA: hypothetical protein VEL11_17180 [Candidatus Bathyarchaeia archaeon]|nr:hypothetical protein [Candidatus Bathyarchaeia archaeon]